MAHWASPSSAVRHRVRMPVRRARIAACGAATPVTKSAAAQENWQTQPLHERLAELAEDLRRDLTGVSDLVADAPRVLVVVLRGPAEHCNELLMRGALTRSIVHATGPVVVDVSRVSRYDAQGLTGLRRAFRTAERQRTVLVFAGMPAAVRGLWGDSRTDPLPRSVFFPTVSAAVAAVTSQCQTAGDPDTVSGAPVPAPRLPAQDPAGESS